MFSCLHAKRTRGDARRNIAARSSRPGWGRLIRAGEHHTGANQQRVFMTKKFMNRRIGAAQSATIDYGKPPSTGAAPTQSAIRDQESEADASAPCDDRLGKTVPENRQSLFSLTSRTT